MLQKWNIKEKSDICVLLLTVFFSGYLTVPTYRLVFDLYGEWLHLEQNSSQKQQVISVPCVLPLHVKI